MFRDENEVRIEEESENEHSGKIVLWEKKHKVRQNSSNLVSPLAVLTSTS